jgi:type IV pilus assembly protein PilA
MKRQKGFMLIELLIVLAIILIIASITIPSLTGVKMHANETSAVASIKAIQGAQMQYQSSYQALGYASSLAALGGSESCNANAGKGVLAG